MYLFFYMLYSNFKIRFLQIYLFLYMLYFYFQIWFLHNYLWSWCFPFCILIFNFDFYKFSFKPLFYKKSSKLDLYSFILISRYVIINTTSLEFKNFEQRFNCSFILTLRNDILKKY